MNVFHDLWKFPSFQWGMQLRGEGEQGERSLPSPETEKIVVEIWSYLPVLYNFGAVAEISWKVMKCQFSIEIVIKKSQNFNNFVFSGPNAKILVCRFLAWPCRWKLLVRCWVSCIFLTNYSQFSPNISKNFAPLPIFVLDLSDCFNFFDRFLN